MIKVTKANQKSVVTKRNDVLAEKVTAGKITAEQLADFADTCVGFNHKTTDPGCQKCPDNAFCQEVEAATIALINGQDEKPETTLETGKIDDKTGEFTPDAPAAAEKLPYEKPTIEEVPGGPAAVKETIKFEKKSAAAKIKARVEEKAPESEASVPAEVPKSTILDAVILKYDYSAISDRTMASKIRDLTKAAKRTQKTAIVSMIELGKHLSDARDMFPTNNGQFFDWLIIEFDMVPQQFYNTINVYKRFGTKINQIGDKIAFSTLATLASDSYSEDEVTAVVAAVNDEKISGSLTSIQDFVKKLRIKEETKAAAEDNDEADDITSQDDGDDDDDQGKPEPKAREAKPAPGLDISDDVVDFKDFGKELSAFVKLIQATDTVNESQFKQLQAIYDDVIVLNDELKLKLTEVAPGASTKGGV